MPKGGIELKNKLFNKKIPHACKNCLNSHSFNSKSEVLCRIRGVVGQNDSCRKYRYDVTKRIPEKATLAGNYSSDDFVL